MTNLTKAQQIGLRIVADQGGSVSPSSWAMARWNRGNARNMVRMTAGRILHGWMRLGYLNKHVSRKYSETTYTLTPKGWAALGQEPPHA